mmetsp:Transcript_81172/g.94624  ORF Transcript_81172/g.94624 Transcript_81172/m.94624 type:complete len:193 (-) Transcript_81172:91-669(-)
MDTLAALALATELPCERQLLSRNPEPKRGPIITKAMWWNISVQSVLQVGVQLLLLAYGHRPFGLERFDTTHLTIVFNVFVWLQVFNFFNARLLTYVDASVCDNLENSRTLLHMVAGIVVAQMLMVEFGGKFMSTAPLSAAQWVFCISMGSTSLIAGGCARAVWRHHLRTGRDVPIFSAVFRRVEHQLGKQKA